MVFHSSLFDWRLIVKFWRVILISLFMLGAGVFTASATSGQEKGMLLGIGTMVFCIGVGKVIF